MDHDFGTLTPESTLHLEHTIQIARNILAGKPAMHVSTEVLIRALAQTVVYLADGPKEPGRAA